MAIPPPVPGLNANDQTTSPVNALIPATDLLSKATTVPLDVRAMPPRSRSSLNNSLSLSRGLYCKPAAKGADSRK